MRGTGEYVLGGVGPAERRQVRALSVEAAVAPFASVYRRVRAEMRGGVNP